jgi:poly(3-hydroxybutyrate) depolymerase
MRIIGSTQSNFLCILLLSFLLVSTATVSQTWTGKTMAVNGNTGGFYEYLPAGYADPANNTKKYPLIIFIHGLGELGNGGSDLPKVLNTGLPQYINQSKFPASFTVGGVNYSFIVICPQFIAWPGAADVDAVINYAAQQYRVDVSRIYVTGLSMGGGATWDYAGSSATAASKIAAIVPICGASWPDINRAKVMATANLPVWATHNDGDGVVSVSNTNGYVDGINSFNPAIRAQKTIWQSGSHDAWTKTYDPSYKLDGVLNCYEWMLQYSRSGAPAPSPAPAPAPALSVWIDKKTDVICNGEKNGTATIALTGGTAPFTYSWNTNPVQTTSTATNLAPGSYTVTVKDANNVTATAIANIAEPSKLVLNVSAGTIGAAGGTTSVSVSATGGNAPYAFTGPTSNVTAGTYTYSVTDAKGCKDSKTITITEPAPIAPAPPTIKLQGSFNPIKCYGGTTNVTLTAEGGTAPYVYDGKTNDLKAGTYSFGVTDANGFKGSLSLTISEPAQLALKIAPGTITKIGGQTNVSLDATGGTAPFSYTGTTSNLKAGTYQYSVADANGCSATGSVELKEPGIKLASFGINTVDTVIRLNWSTSYEYGIEKFEIEKSKEDKVFKSLKQIRSHMTTTTNTVLTYNSDDETAIKGSNSYRLYAVTVFGERVLLVERNLFFNDLGNATVKNLVDRLEVNVTSAKEENVYLILYDGAGRIMKRMQETKSSNLFRTTVSMSDIPKGYYILKLMTSSGLQLTKQVVKP